MGWFRSSEMKYMSLVVPETQIYQILSELGEKGVVQFTDLNKSATAYQRTYANQVKVCNEMQRIVRYFEEELSKLDVEIPAPPDIKLFVRDIIESNRSSTQPPGTRLNTFHEELKAHERDLRDISENYQKLLTVYNSKLELKYVLNEALRYSDNSNDELLADAQAANQNNDVVKFNYMTGVINSEEYLSFQKMIFRSTRGNCFVRFTPILHENNPDGTEGNPVEFIDPETEEKVEKHVFIAMYPGRQIESQLRKICTAYGASIYDIPDLENVRELNEEIRTAADDIADAQHIKLYNRKQAESTGAVLARSLQQWKIRINMELGTYDTLNKLDIRDTGVAVGKGWVLASAAEEVANLVRHAGGSEAGGGSINESPRPWPTPPTHFLTNKYTGTFQGIVNTYGVPEYQEANPAIVTMITFPFSFAIMFGDVGHGLCWLVASIYMIAAEKSLTSTKLNETVEMVVNARYMLFLMSFFAVYNGFIYNDTFALGVTYFGESQWNVTEDGAVVQSGVYPFGLDPVWKISSNEILFGNSLKMKISVTFGVLHMVLGVFFKGANKCFFKDWNGFFNEFVPQIIFILSFFGYMILMIFMKWSTDWVMVGDVYGGAAPSLITTLVDIALAPGSIANGSKLYGWEDGDETQATVQKAILGVAFVCIPWMLIPKPLIENCQNQRKKKLAEAEGGAHHHDAHDDDEEAHEEHSCSDLFIHQVIETIEYVLGCVSNTASYLRLWALSLAHMELSKTFWDLIMVNVLNMEMSTPVKAILLFCAYSVFAAITAGVLLAMDFLECFLHALRLHWVEFQNKFFSATGHAFTAFSFERIIKDAQAEEDE